MLSYVWIALFLPLLGFLVLFSSAGHLTRKKISWIGCGTIIGAFFVFSMLFIEYQTPTIEHLFDWIPVKGLEAPFALKIDPLSLLMTLIITGVGSLIHIYSIGYMEHDEDYARYFACMNLFVFAMLLLVLASNVALLFVGWEGVGLASYLLIGYWYTRPTAAAAAVKAFVVNRVGDLGLFLGLILIFHLFGTSDIDSVMQQASVKYPVGAPMITLLTLLLFLGAVGKSAQLPLHVWLPDAMEGPTPVSALIHAATMVTAGVYLVVRLHLLFLLAPWTLNLIGIVGGATALFAALCAMGQTDLKRVLAYSTVSQLGYMFLACGVGAFYAAMFHLTMHAFMKALLFMTAGNVVHMLHDTTEMGKMGALSRIFKKTHWLFLIGVLAMSGVPPLAAFFSKDLILEQEHLAGYDVLYWMGLITAALTAYYLTRAYFLTFRGPSHVEPNLLKELKEAPKVMLIPVTVLGILTVFGGFLGFNFGALPPLQKFLERIGISLPFPEPFNPFTSYETIISVAGAFLGIGVAALLYTKKPVQLFKKGFLIDSLYETIFVLPLKHLSRWISHVVEPKAIEGSIHHVGKGVYHAAYGLQRMQSGQIRSYVAWMVFGLVAVIGYFVGGK
jgi:NADH-quinone oxidoreductase subunit L